MTADADSLPGYLAERCAWIDAALEAALPAETVLPASLHRAMRYSIFAGGKRLRPVLLLAACEAVGGDPRAALPAACAVEMVHTYSLVHDDLPAMDDDDFRRGRPTSHRVFGEATAILAGDGLLTQAFIQLSNGDYPPELAVKLVGILAHAIGSQGMVGGQVADMEAEGREVELPLVEYIHAHKTGALLLACVQLGALVGGADEEALRALTRYGEAAGLAFQIADDILDVTGTLEEIGKDAGSDQARNKATFPAVLGVEAARRRAGELQQLALDAIRPLGERARPLAAIADYIVDRTR